MGFRKNKYMTAMSSRKNAMKSLSVAVLVGIASLGATNPAQAEDTTTITTTLIDGTEHSLELQTTYGDGNTSVTTNYTVLGQEVPYTYKFDNLYGDTENGNTSVDKSVTVLGQPVTFTYKYDSSTTSSRQTSFNGQDINSNFIGNTVFSGPTLVGGAIYNSSGSIGNIIGDFIGNYSQYQAQGGAIYNTGTITSITGDFIRNYTYTSNGSSTSDFTVGGAIYNSNTITSIKGDFIGNYATTASIDPYYNQSADGGAIFNKGTIGNITGDFISNYAYSEASQTEGGAIYNTGTITSITGDFIGNYAASGHKLHPSSKGGAIYNVRGTIDDITGNFIGNYAKSETGAGAAQGGAIYNAGTITSITGDFIDNYAYGDSMDGLSTAGGAIFNKGDSAQIDIINGNFVNNSATFYDEDPLGGGAIYNTGTITSITGDFIGNYVMGHGKGGAISNEGKISNISGDFIGNYVKDVGGSIALGGAIYNTNSLTITNSSFIGNHTYSYSGDALGGAIYTTADLDIIAKDGYTSVFSGNWTNNDNFINDSVSNAITLDGANLNFQMVNGGKFVVQDKITSIAGAGKVYAKSGVSNFEELLRDQGFKDTPTETFLSVAGYSTLDEFAQQEGYENIDGLLADWGYDSIDEFLKNELGLYGDTAAEQFLNVQGYSSVDEFLTAQGVDTGADVVYPTVNIQGDDINNTTFYLYNDINFANVNIGNTTINTVNNLVHNYNFESLMLTADTNMVVDVDLANQTMDRFSAKEYGEHQGSLNVTGMNLLSDAVDDTTRILFAENGLKDNVTTSVGEVAYTPIYKYNVSYDKSGEDGYFVFDRFSTANSGSSGGATGGAPSVESFNPAILGSSSSATVGALGTMNQTMNNVFQHSDNYMHIPYLERVSMRDRNKYALSLTGDSTGMGRYSPLYQRAEETTSVWVKPYATFETVGLKNGPKVHNNAYGTLIGFDTGLQPIKRGWDRVFTGYIGYNGASQRYSGIDSIQNGGLIGGTVTMYKGNFFNATTVSVGASVANNQTMYGNEDFAMLLSGIGNKTGYNIEFKEGKLILQPSMLMSYTFVNTFDYTNAAGVRIDNKPLHALQLAPGVKVIGNLKGGWQPYASVQMVWNLMGESNATANGVKLPEMSIKPYVQYGVGVQKRIKDHFTAYGQAMVQNGGRNGVSLTAGFRWALGKDNAQKVEAKKQKGEIAKQVQDDRGKYIDNRTSSLDVGGVMPRAAEHKKILKQMTSSQKAAHGGKYASTTRSAKAGMLRQL